MRADHSPHLGHPAARYPHGLRFLSWARDRAQTTLARQLLALIGDLQTEEALGSALAFLTHTDTARALRQWRSHAPAARLHSLSEDLAKSSKLAEALPPGDKPTRVFRKTLSDWYLAAQLACGKRKLARVTYLDDEARAPKPKLDPKSSLTLDYRPLSAAVAMEYLRSRSRGVSSARAGTGTFGRLSPDSQTTLESRIGEVARRVTGSTSATPPDPVAYLAGLVPEIRWPALLSLAKQCDAKNFRLPVGALEQLTPGMQIILGNKEHFNRVKELKTSLGLHPTDIAIRVPARPRNEMQVLLKGKGLENFLETSTAKGKRRRIDSYTSNDADNPISAGCRFAPGRSSPVRRAQLSNVLLTHLTLVSRSSESSSNP